MSIPTHLLFAGALIAPVVFVALATYLLSRRMSVENAGALILILALALGETALAWLFRPHPFAGITLKVPADLKGAVDLLFSLLDAGLWWFSALALWLLFASATILLLWKGRAADDQEEPG